MESNPNRISNGGMRGMLDALWRIHTQDQTAVLGLVIATEGSTYQKPGALVLLDADGMQHGVISGGCLEPALEKAALAVHANGRATLVDFDTRSDEDLLFGSGIGCRGRVQLLLLPLPPQAPLARALFSAFDQTLPLQLSFALTGDELGAGAASFVAKQTMPQSIFYWHADGLAAAASVVTNLSLTIAPPPRLLLLGAGPETPALAGFARRLGWLVNVVEHRARWAMFAQQAQVDRIFSIAPAAAANQLAGESADALIVMSHNYAMDLEHLVICARRHEGYVGLLGPTARRDALLAELVNDDVQRLIPRLHAPVGLHLGGHGAEAIALAIVAELQQYFSMRMQPRLELTTTRGDGA